MGPALNGSGCSVNTPGKHSKGESRRQSKFWGRLSTQSSQKVGGGGGGEGLRLPMPSRLSPTLIEKTMARTGVN